MARRRQQIIPKRGELYLVNFDPTIGSEIKKTRPALIIQNNIANRYSPVTIVAAVSSHFNKELYPIEVVVGPPEGGLSHPSVIFLNQIRAIDKQRLVKKLGAVKPETMTRVNHALEISLGMIDI